MILSNWRATARLASFAAALVATILLTLTPVPAQDRKKGKKKGKGGQQHVFSGRAPIHPFDVILARPTDRSVTVSVLAYQDLDCRLSYGTQKGKHSDRTKIQRLTAGRPFEFVLADLKSDTRYYYRLNHRAPGAKEFAEDKEAVFHTRRKPGSGFTFTVQADSHLDQNTRTALYERTLANALADGPDFHIDLGDTFMTDKYARHTDALPQYLAQRYYLGQLCRSAPLFLVLGNHDGERGDRHDGSADSMPAWSCLTRKKYFPNPWPDHFYTGNTTEMKRVGRLENYYAWEWGDALFVALDPFWPTVNRRAMKTEGNWARTLGEQQYRRLQKTLEGSKATFKFVFIHHLVGGLDPQGRGGSEAALLYEWGGKGKEGTDEFKTKRPGWGMPIHSLLVKHKVSAVFHGHDHFFARQELDGVVYQLVPQPGHQGGERLRDAADYGYIRGDFLPPSGHIRVKVADGKAIVEYVRAYLTKDETDRRKNGMVAHSYTIKAARR